MRLPTIIASDALPSVKVMRSRDHFILVECSTFFRRLVGIEDTGMPPEELLYKLSYF